MSGLYGLLELILVFGLVLGWAFWELHKTRNCKLLAKLKDNELI